MASSVHYKRKFPSSFNNNNSHKRPRYEDVIPDNVVPVANLSHLCGSQAVCKASNPESVPMFNAPIYLANKTHIGKVDEIFGPLNEFMFSVQLSDKIDAKGFDKTTTFYIDPTKTLPKSRFVPKPPPDPLAPKVKRKGPPGGGRGRGGFVPRGGFAPRGGFGQRAGGRGGRGGFVGNRGGGRGGGPNSFSRGGTRGGGRGGPRGAERRGIN